LKYTEDEGSVAVDLHELPSDADGMVRLVYRVADTGMGMSEEFMEHMYESFSRQTDSRVNNVQGTGLGLAITKQMVDLMGGTIECQSKLGEGTTFIVTLDVPIAERDSEDMTLESVDALVIDDDEVLLQTAQHTLNSLDARVDVASSGARAIEMIGARHNQHNDYSVIIVDWKMPDMDGIEVVRRVRALIGDEVPIILISAYDWSDIEESAKDAGADGFISKPLFRSTMYHAINELLHLADTPVASEDDHSDIAGMRVLVAEDNDINWEIISMLLDMHGIETARAENGQIAVDMVSSMQPGDFDLVFMDVQMPVMNGIEATKAIRALNVEGASTIPIIATTADAFSEDVALCLDAGMNGHIAKPIDIKIVLNEIRKVKEGKL
ncbi:MAG: response regulator, partial [Eggerthellaceae bacterium]|nr:response regulator [Eggerthellaceae bacterium]